MLIWWYVLAALGPDRQREDDAPAPVRAYRGTTSLAKGLRPDGHRSLTAHHPAVTGRTRPVLIRPSPSPNGRRSSALSSGSSPVIAGSSLRARKSSGIEQHFGRQYSAGEGLHSSGEGLPDAYGESRNGG